MKYKDIKRRKLSPKQLELIEKLHWLHCYSKGDFELQSKMDDLFEKACKFLY